MQYRVDPKSGNELSALGLGCMRLPMRLGAIDQEAVEALVASAVEQGVNYFDTAYLYPGSEEALGAALAKLGVRERVYVATKLPHGKVRSAADLDRFFSTSLERLQTGYVDYYLVHNVTSLAQWERLVALGVEDWVAARRADGSIRRIGFSFHGTLPEFRKLLDAFSWDFVQIQYNYVNENYQAGREGLQLAASRGLPVVIMEPLLGGKLATGLPKAARRVFEQADPGATPASWALRWLWDQPQVTVVLSGMNAAAQLDDNCATAARSLPGCLTAQEHAAVDAVREEFRRTYRVPCTGCNYCMPCPKGINIPASFAAYNESFSMGLVTGVMHYAISAGGGGEQLHLASDCVGCGACVRKCPQGIDVPAELKAVRRRLEPPGFSAAARLLGKVMSRG